MQKNNNSLLLSFALYFLVPNLNSEKTLMSTMALFSGNANPLLAKKISEKLNIPLGKASVERFSDGEIMVEIHENVRGRDAYIIQSTCSPCNDNIMEILTLADALRRSSAARITAVIPYYGYARQDRRVRSARVPITAKVVADLLSSVGISRVVTVDLHADQIQGFFYMPVDNVYATPAIIEDIRQHHYNKLMVVSPDVGGVVRARAIAKKIDDAEMSIIDKRRTGPNKSEVMHIIGDPKDRDCLIVDDIVDTAGTLCTAAAELKKHGAHKVVAYITHPVLSGSAIQNIKNSQLDEIVVTNTIPLSKDAASCDKIREIDLSQMLATTILRVNGEESISSMFNQ
jgi:ribose-phosphate pyrophosphokinase